MTVKDLKAASDSETPDSQDAVAESQEAPSLEELASRQQAEMAKLKETTSAFDTLLEETISAVDESISQSKKMTDEVRDQASEKAAAVMAEAQARAQTIVSEADREASAQDRAAMGKVSVLIEAARSSAGRVARPSREQLPMLTGEIWAALEASIEQSLRTVLKDLQNLEEETKLSEGQEGPQVKSKEADQGFPRAGDSENHTESQHSNGFKAEMDGSASSSETGSFATKPDVDDSQGDGDKDPGNNAKRNGSDDLRQLRPTVQVIDAPEPGRNGEQEIPAQAGVNGSSGQAMRPRLYSGDITLVILLKMASDERTDILTPEQMSRQIKNTPGGSVVDSGMLGKEYFIKARFETPVSLNEVLDGVSDWEDFEYQSQKVKEYQNRAWAVDPSTSSKKLNDEKRILVTL